VVGVRGRGSPEGRVVGFVSPAPVSKGGTVVVTSVGCTEVGIPISPMELTLYQKRIQGTMFGACNAVFDIAQQIRLYREGRLKLDELVTRTYTLDEVNEGFADLRAGRNLRGVVLF
jgi:Zn-dependent alcohol dehydrogenase